jgi:hypothetical protein
MEANPRRRLRGSLVSQKSGVKQNPADATIILEINLESQDGP